MKLKLSSSYVRSYQMIKNTIEDTPDYFVKHNYIVIITVQFFSNVNYKLSILFASRVNKIN